MITISNTNVASDLNYFPLMVKTASDTDIGEGTTDTTNGYDIRFTDADGTTILPYEKESFTVVEGVATFIFWVRVPTIYNAPTGTQNTIYIYYGNSSANTDWTAATSSIANCTSISNAQCVWKENASQSYAGVWHLKEAQGSSNVDSTSNANASTPQGTTKPTQVAGKIDGSLNFDGTNNYVEVANSASLTITNTVTVDLWAKFSVLNAGVDYGLISKYPGILTMWLWKIDRNIYFEVDGSNIRVNGAPAGGFQTDTWYHIVGTFTKSGGANGINLYVNNVRVATGNPGSGSAATSVNALKIGYVFNSGINQYMPGILDEVRVANAARSADWIKFEYYNDSSATNEISIAASGETADNAAPTTSASGGAYSFGNWTTSASVSVSLACADAGTGCEVGYPKYCLDTDNTCTPTTTYTTPLDVSTSGISYIRYYSVDTGGNTETVQSSTIKIDTVAPTTADNSGPGGSWVNSAQTITLAPSDATSGVAWTKYCTDSNNTCDPASGTSYSGLVYIPTNGISYFRYASQDNAGNTQTTVSITFMIDTTSPVTTASGGGYTFGNWATNSVSTTLSCADTGGSGCGNKYYCQDTSNSCTPSTLYSGAIATSTEGTSYIRYYSIDEQNNSETIKSSTIKIDTSAPTTSDNFTNNATWVNASQTITLTPADVTSGISWTKYCTDATNTCDPTAGTAYTIPVVISTEGTSYFRYASQDNAGNTQSTVSKTVMIDTVAPTPQVLVRSVDISSKPTISASATITNEGHMSYEYQYEWCIVTNADDDCGSGSSSAARAIVPGVDFDTTLTATKSTAGEYYFKLIVTYGGNQSTSTRSFTLTNTPTGGSTGGGGGNMSIVKKSLTTAQISAIIGLLQSFGADAKIISNVQISLSSGFPISTNNTVNTNLNYVFLRYFGYGDHGEDVLALQKILVKLGFLTATPNGNYGPATFLAIKKFQTANGLSPVGRVGPLTKNLLNSMKQ